jgi:transposase-like protein
MRYSYEFKLECVKLYKETGTYPPIPESVKPNSFKFKVRCWSRLYDQHGEKALKHSNTNRNWTAEDKLVLINQCKAGKSILSVAVEAGIGDGLLYSWIRKYDELGYNGLVESKKGRPSKNPDMRNKKVAQRELNESELEELVRLRAENEYIKTEIEVLKKSIALRREKEAAQLKAKKQHSSKNLENKDTN